MDAAEGDGTMPDVTVHDHPAPPVPAAGWAPLRLRDEQVADMAELERRARALAAAAHDGSLELPTAQAAIAALVAPAPDGRACRLLADASLETASVLVVGPAGDTAIDGTFVLRSDDAAGRKLDVAPARSWRRVGWVAVVLFSLTAAAAFVGFLSASSLG